MKKFSKSFLILMIHAMISSTLVFSPVAFAKKGTTETQFDDQDMDKKHADSDLTYKDLQTFEKNMKNDDGKFGVDYIAMLAGMLFAMTALTGPLPKRYDHAKNDCPMDISGQITIPLMKIAGLTFIIGEIYNYIKFSKVKGKVMEMDGQINYNKTVQTDLKEDSEYKSQIETYDKLNDIYWEQWKTFKTKRDIYTAVEVATRTAEVIDGGMGIACMGVCTATQTMNKSRVYANIAAIAADNTSFSTGAAFCPQSALASCATYISSSLDRIGTIEASILETEGKGAKELAKSNTERIKELKNEGYTIAEILAANVSDGLASSASETMFKFEQKALMKDTADAKRNYTDITTDQKSTQISLKKTEAQLKTCLADMKKEQATYAGNCNPPTKNDGCALATSCAGGMAEVEIVVNAREGGAAGIKAGYTSAQEAISAMQDAAKEFSSAIESVSMNPDVSSLGGDAAKKGATDTMGNISNELYDSYDQMIAAGSEPYHQDLEVTLDAPLTCCGTRGVGMEGTWDQPPTIRIAIPTAPGLAMLRRDVKPKEEGEGLMEKVKGFFKNVMGKIGDAGTIHKDFLPYFENEEKLLEVAFSNIMYRKAFSKMNRAFELPLGPMMRDLALANYKHDLNTTTDLSFVQLRQVAFNDYHEQYLTAIKSKNSSKSKLLDISMTVLSKVGIASAHAGDSAGAAMGVIGGVLGLFMMGGAAGGKVGGFVKKLGNLVEKVYSAMTRSMITRVTFWAIYDALVTTLRMNAKKEMDLIEKQMDVIYKLKEQVAGTADDSVTVGEGDRVSVSTGVDYSGRYNAELKQNSYSSSSTDKLAKKDCISVGNSASMGACPGKVTSNKFKIRGMQKLKTQSPMGYKGASMSMTTASGMSAAGASGMDRYLAANMDGMHKFNSAISKQLTKQRARIKKMNSKNDSKLSSGVLKAKKKSNSAMQNFVDNLKAGNLRGAINGAAVTSSGSSAIDKMTGNTTKNKGSVASVAPTKAYQPYKPNLPKSNKNTDYDLGFDDDDEGVEDADFGDTVAGPKAEQRLEDYDFDANDSNIEKRKDVSLFKLLSNRYILSYPKVLVERKSKKKKTDVPKKDSKTRKEEEIEDILGN